MKWEKTVPNSNQLILKNSVGNIYLNQIGYNLVIMSFKIEKTRMEKSTSMHGKWNHICIYEETTSFTIHTMNLPCLLVNIVARPIYIYHSPLETCDSKQHGWSHRGNGN